MRLAERVDGSVATAIRVITLCGSTRFRDAFEEWLGRLSLQGAAVFPVICFGHFLEVPLSAEEKAAADRLHFAKIAMSDEIFVLDVDGYIGESTRNEIAFAEAHGIPVRYLSQVAPGWTPADRRFRHRA